MVEVERKGSFGGKRGGEEGEWGGEGEGRKWRRGLDEIRRSVRTVGVVGLGVTGFKS